jgi:hypothetical protein
MLLGDIVVGMFYIGLILIPILGYFAVKNSWKITKYL